MGDDDSFMTPLLISRAVVSLDEVVAFYKVAFEIDPLASATADDGTKAVQFQLEDAATVRLQFVERPGQTGATNAQWFASFLNATNRKYMGADYKGCWPIWGDDHTALDGSVTDTSVFWSRWQKTGYPVKMHDNGIQKGVPSAHLYAMDPGGWQIQFDGTFTDPPADIFPRAESNCYICCQDTEVVNL